MDAITEYNKRYEFFKDIAGEAIKHIDTPHRQQLWSYLRIARKPYGMLINFSPEGLYSEWYHYVDATGEIDRIKLL